MASNDRTDSPAAAAPQQLDFKFKRKPRYQDFVISIEVPTNANVVNLDSEDHVETADFETCIL